MITPASGPVTNVEKTGHWLCLIIVTLTACVPLKTEEDCEVPPLLGRSGGCFRDAAYAGQIRKPSHGSRVRYPVLHYSLASKILIQDRSYILKCG